VTEQVARRCRDYDSDERSLRIALVEDLRRRVPFRAHVWALIDPESEVATAPLATVPDPLMAQLPGIVRRRYLTTVNRWDRMDAPVASLYQATDADPAKSLLYREVLGPAGIGDIASIVFRDRFGIWAFLDLAVRYGCAVHRRGTGDPRRGRRSDHRRSAALPGEKFR
jgi:hypothetical protein